MEEWKEYKLGEICEILDSKRIPLSSMQRQNRQGNYPYYGAQGVIDYVDDYLFDGTYLLVAEDGNNVLTQKEDIAIIAKGKFWVNNHAHILGYNGKCDLYLLGYILNSMDISSYVTGTAQPKLNQQNLSNIPIILPSKDKQDKIVSILKSLDDKIENNRKINENLEQQAQALFKSWFVDFEPFRDQPFVESELGMIPEGWRVGTLSEIAEYSKLRISIKEIDTHTYVSTENMLANKQGITEASGLPDVENVTKYEIGDVLISNIRPYFKKLHYCNHIGGCSGDVMCFHPLSKEYRGYLYCSLYDDVFFDYVMSGAKGTKMPRGDKRQIMNYRIIIPSNSIINQFNNFVLLLLSQIDNNRKQSLHLSQLRDTLLPKLMSGEITI